MPREDLCFVDFIVPRGSGISLSIILDMTRGIATAITGILPTPKEVMIPLIIRAERRMLLSSVHVVFEHAAIDGPFLIAHHAMGRPEISSGEDRVGLQLQACL